MRKFLRSAIVLLLIISIALMLSGCWDENELDALFIVTGLALDANPDPSLIDLTIQIGKPKSKSSDSGGSDQGSSTVLLKVTQPTVQEALKMADEDTSRTLLLQHTQVILFGSQFAEAGVLNKIDQFLRDQEMRMEILVLVVDGRAENALSAKLDQEDISGVYLSRLVRDVQEKSPYASFRLFDLVSRLQNPTSSFLVPLASVGEANGKPTISLNGMAVFKRDRMVGRFSDLESLGYLMAMGSLKRSGIAAESDMGRAIFDIMKLDTKRKVSLRSDGGVKVTLNVDAVLRISQLVGFSDISPKELMTELVTLAQNQIQSQIYNAFDLARSMNADIFEFGNSVYEKYPKVWPDMEKDWDTYFKDTDLEVQVKVRIPDIGKIAKSLEMDVTSHAN